MQRIFNAYILTGIFGMFVIGICAFVQPEPAQAQLNPAQSPQAILSYQMNMQQRLLRKSNYLPFSTTTPASDMIIFTDRMKRPISEREFMENIRRHRMEVLQAEMQSQNLIEPPPPEEASFQ